jgi:hypothetical protein
VLKPEEVGSSKTGATVTANALHMHNAAVKTEEVDNSRKSPGHKSNAPASAASMQNFLPGGEVSSKLSISIATCSATNGVQGMLLYLSMGIFVCFYVAMTNKVFSLKLLLQLLLQK